MNIPDFISIQNILHLLVQLIVLVVIIIYLSKKAKIDGVLLLIGHSISFLLSVYHLVIFRFLMQSDIGNLYSKGIIINKIFNYIGAVAYIVFTIGLILLLIDKSKTISEKSDFS